MTTAEKDRATRERRPEVEGGNVQVPERAGAHRARPDLCGEGHATPAGLIWLAAGTNGGHVRRAAFTAPFTPSLDAARC